MGYFWDGNDRPIGEIITTVLPFVFILLTKLFTFPEFFSSFLCSLYFSYGSLTRKVHPPAAWTCIRILNKKSPWYLCWMCIQILDKKNHLTFVHKTYFCFQKFPLNFSKSSKMRWRNDLILFGLYFSIIHIWIRSYFNEVNQMWSCLMNL